MTYSILARDPKSGAIGAAAATGSLCVGGWVIRGDLQAGMSASQGAKPSTMWGEDVLSQMAAGSSATSAVNTVTSVDSGAAFRQLAALDLSGKGAVHTGNKNGLARGSVIEDNIVVCGNLLSDTTVLDAMIDAFKASTKSFEERLITSLFAAEQSGGDSRGLQSAALLVYKPDSPVITLRIDYHNSPLIALQSLYEKHCDPDYQAWRNTLPTSEHPER
ncbi:DUF1028 domain-containing protein [Enterovibrio sp. ZSDZ35]|uniref:DUF1028 domain-containing protein n=1 Tax=Enterovibrio qingdaonensis TaxID=2899818 RepID=A0ABT5QK61_9GAMM|nr:DUF1028 domain-containing protein [Enterovibrio sp. ZSDZ35]MDD1781053.1 DUF1028 domain-containing protein [Enterovibrio sp. ZSDZ35]